MVQCNAKKVTLAQTGIKFILDLKEKQLNVFISCCRAKQKAQTKPLKRVRSPKTEWSLIHKNNEKFNKEDLKLKYNPPRKPTAQTSDWHHVSSIWSLPSSLITAGVNKYKHPTNIRQIQKRNTKQIRNTQNVIS